MRIGIVTGEYPPAEGGVGDYTRQLALALSRLGHCVHILTGSITSSTPDVSVWDNELPVQRAVASWSWPCLQQIRRWSAEVRADILNIQYEAAAYHLKAAITCYPWLFANDPVPIVVTFHDLMPPYLFPKAGGLRQRVVWAMARNATGVIVTNEMDRSSLSDALGESLPPLSMIPIGSNITPSATGIAARDRWRTENGFEPAELLVGFFGFLNRAKGVETLLEAAAALAAGGVPLKVVFIGGRTGTSDNSNAVYAQEIERLIGQLGLTERVFWTGFAEPAAISLALRAVDMLVLPYREGASLRHGTLHAALAHGLPIITTLPRFSIPELRDRENVLLVPPGDPDALCHGIQSVWSNPTLRAQLALGAEQVAQLFTWERIAERTAAFLASCAGNHQQEPGSCTQ